MTNELGQRPRGALWASVDALIDRAPGVDDLLWHGLGLLAGRRLRERGEQPDARLVEQERTAALRVLGAPIVLERVRAACEGPIVLIKGYEVALLYGDPALRPFVDIDLLVEDSRGTQEALLNAGFVEVGKPELFTDIHHLRPVRLPELPLPMTVEIHHVPKWPDLMVPPATAELLASAVPSSTQVDGISTLPHAQHALILAAHSWAHLPLRRIQELVDIALLAEPTSRAELDALAARWELERVWQATRGCIDSLFYGGPKTWAQRIWAQHLLEARERTVFESHVQRWVAAFWALPSYQAFPTLAAAVADEFTPGQDEGWREKNARAWRALRNAFVARSEHDRELGPGAHRWRRRR